MSPRPGTLYLIDTSAATRMRTHPQIRTVIEDTINDEIAATCITLDLEAGFSARAGRVAEVLAARAQALTFLPVTTGVETRAVEIMELLAARGLHRAAGSFDVLTAAVANHYGAIVLHYDADFEHIAAVIGLRHQWVAPRGSID